VSQNEAVGVELRLAADPKESAEELEVLSLALRRELLQLVAVESVEHVSVGEPPADARGLDLAAIGVLLVTLAQSATALEAMARAVRSWLKLQPARKIKLQIGEDTLELTGATSSDQERLVTAWIERHARP